MGVGEDRSKPDRGTAVPRNGVSDGGPRLAGRPRSAVLLLTNGTLSDGARTIG